MPPLPNPTRGAKVSIKGRPLRFSFWPVYKGTKRAGLQSNVFAVDPWTIIRDHIRSDCPTTAASEALACLEQASDFYKSSLNAGIAAARPLQMYYCFMNLVKALLLTRGGVATFDRATHGLSERLDVGRRELQDAFLDAYPSPKATGEMQVFGEFYKFLLGQSVPAGARYRLPVLLPQILPGHRLWADAADEEERFISIHEIRLMQDSARKRLWLNLLMVEGDLTRLGVAHKKLLSGSQMNTLFREVKSTVATNGRHLLCFEQINKTAFTHRAADELQVLVDQLKRYTWVTVNSSQPYRRYYIYVAPNAEHTQVLPQLLSIFAITYYLGSITRYRPQHFDRILSGAYGPRIEEFISAQPLQFIYLVASEFAKQEVTKPALI